ncbi:MAG: tRNA (adenosine(37)-N6)-threonylcarbamoyltransferase complex ATPase subunit type 1 TsaE [Rhodospirillaceae bacterium]|jgi:tRNA threonylcarbamoyladenosine biosynthesis protein TsaE|nr:tRNA (adenosine(37)-N6)-threonylcarbamoyltransferase complex ATPase subunit type 1 TsaE [Rhodospirillaceae bacterium]MBT6203507.1 tRNA (adenosine(37)-N6)-threonylcarbamoyltransferase complex ATPase subunit type 1 TsaE [Rhodospirillaceae bacterium]MBT6511818.1 tRNA (adenosine(37)-N6)-threonylcarbamoyltransferase complex ATPase subunit type 1 TsaE [Rhodospirillaceae bacterium]MBT7649182.1 tRNA (adenosine(37)-N6)-threonylcarbamoyltransferase complex ATPase subunit type 1 TsaE [Rhodospirillaceae 
MPLPSQITCRDIAQTNAFAAELAKVLRVGDVVLLDGPIGAGKTHFVRALASAMGSNDNVTSPTYTIMHVYETDRGQLLHLDAYRLSGVAEYRDLGIDDLAPEAITVVEWGGTVAAAHPEHLMIEFRIVDGDDNARELLLSGIGQRWAGKMGAQA